MKYVQIEGIPPSMCPFLKCVQIYRHHRDSSYLIFIIVNTIFFLMMKKSENGNHGKKNQWNTANKIIYSNSCTRNYVSLWLPKRFNFGKLCLFVPICFISCAPPIQLLMLDLSIWFLHFYMVPRLFFLIWTTYDWKYK